MLQCCLCGNCSSVSSTSPSLPSPQSPYHYAVCSDPLLLPPPHSAPLTVPTVCEETAVQCRNVNQPPLSDGAQASSHQTYQPTCSRLPFGQQEVQPPSHGPPTFPPTPPPNALACQPPPANTQVTAPSSV